MSTSPGRAPLRMAGTAAASLMLWIVAASHAMAHHPMGGKTPSNFMEGFLSGIGHPVIGPDHLAFIVAIGIAAALVPAGIGLIAAFISASTLGVLLQATSIDLPLVEKIVALSVVAAGGLLAFGYGNRSPIWLLLAAVAGLFHGHAFGEAVIGAERYVIGSYLLGLAIIAAAIAAVMMLFTSQVLRLRDVDGKHLRTAGALLACVGVVMLAITFVSA